MSSQNFPSEEFAQKIYLILLDAYKERCIKNDNSLDKEYLSKLVKESIHHGMMFNYIYHQELSTFLGIKSIT
jgi:hypothetical protein